MEIDDLTLVVPVRERRNTLDNLIQYYSTLKCSKLIVDSSEKSLNSKWLTVFKKTGFTYVYVGPMDYWEKMYTCSSLVKTSYMVDNSDDDVCLQSGLKEAVYFLKNNPNYVSASGELYSFNEKHGCFPKHHKRFLAQLHNDSPSDSPFKRTKDFMTKRPVSLNHSVWKTSILQDFWKMMRNNPNLEGVALLERVMMMYAMIRGNKKILPVLFQMKRIGGPRVYRMKGISKEVKGGRKLGTLLNNKALRPLGQVLAKETKKSEKRCTAFLEEVLYNHLQCRQDSRRGWFIGEAPSVDLCYDEEDIQRFKNIYGLK
jgi:glycosyltransferase domain-containing protein